jgi:hypothetical protein
MRPPLTVARDLSCAMARAARPSFVTTVAGATLSMVAACNRLGGGLPAWSDVDSGHPEGATNPPSPVLEVTRDGARCFKAFESGMAALPADTFVLDIRGESYSARWSGPDSRAREIRCPEGVAAALERHQQRVTAASAKAAVAPGATAPSPSASSK